MSSYARGYSRHVPRTPHPSLQRPKTVRYADDNSYPPASMPLRRRPPPVYNSERITVARPRRSSSSFFSDSEDSPPVGTPIYESFDVKKKSSRGRSLFYRIFDFAITTLIWYGVAVLVYRAVVGLQNLDTSGEKVNEVSVYIKESVDSAAFEAGSAFHHGSSYVSKKARSASQLVATPVHNARSLGHNIYQGVSQAIHPTPTTDGPALSFNYIIGKITDDLSVFTLLDELYSIKQTQSSDLNGVAELTDKYTKRLAKHDRDVEKLFKSIREIEQNQLYGMHNQLVFGSYGTLHGLTGPTITAEKALHGIWHAAHYWASEINLLALDAASIHDNFNQDVKRWYKIYKSKISTAEFNKREKDFVQVGEQLKQYFHKFDEASKQLGVVEKELHEKKEEGVVVGKAGGGTYLESRLGEIKETLQHVRDAPDRRFNRRGHTVNVGSRSFLH